MNYEMGYTTEEEVELTRLEGRISRWSRGFAGHEMLIGWDKHVRDVRTVGELRLGASDSWHLRHVSQPRRHFTPSRKGRIVKVILLRKAINEYAPPPFSNYRALSGCLSISTIQTTSG